MLREEIDYVFSISGDSAETLADLKQIARMIMYALAYPSSVQKKSDREQDGLFGLVRTVQLESARISKLLGLFVKQRRIPVRIVSYNPAGNKSEEVIYNSSDSDKQIELYSYDTSGRKAEWIIRQGSIFMKTTYFYDQNRNRIEALEHVIDDDSIITRRYTFTYDHKGNQIQGTYYDDSRIEIKASYSYHYDDKGHLTTVDTLNSQGVIYHKVTYTYDSKAKVITKAAYRSDGALYDKVIFAYEANGKTEERFIYKDDRTLDYRDVYIYEDKGNLIEMSRYDANGYLLSKTSYAFEYDFLENWIKKTIQCWDIKTDRPTSTWIEYRIIHYY